MSIVLASMIVLCPPTKFDNKTTDQWNETDEQHYVVARKRCGEIYGDDSACVKIFRKRTTERDFSVICGGSDKNLEDILK